MEGIVYILNQVVILTSEVVLLAASAPLKATLIHTNSFKVSAKLPYWLYEATLNSYGISTFSSNNTEL